MKNTPKTIILTAPQGFGKTTHVHQLSQWLGFGEVIDDWFPKQPLKEGFMHLTNSDVDDIERYHKGGVMPYVLVQMSIKA